jgi:glycosidase
MADEGWTFYEYFHGDNGAGLGASHQTGWTGVIARAMHLFATTTADQVLELSKAAAVTDIGKPVGSSTSSKGSRGIKTFDCNSHCSMNSHSYPSLYQVNTRVWLTELSRQLGCVATLDDIPDGGLDEIAEKGFDWLWLLSVWQTGPAGQRVSRTNPEWRKEFQQTLPDLCDADVPGSGFAITEYAVHQGLGGDAALARLRKRLRKRGLRLMLDFVPNHTGLDHSWVESHTEYYIRGTELDLARAPQNYVWIKRKAGDLLLAHGRDPYFPGWPDTLQLNYGNPATQEAMRGELLRIAGQCDGLRCDMAMLVLPEVFQRTWGIPAKLFWPEATRRVREQFPEFCFMAEVYWDLEWTMQQQGFDYAYDKRLYDRLREGHAQPVRDHLRAELDYQNKLARFLENHDEPRAASTFSAGQHEAAAVITYLAPGLRFFHQGQFEGRLKRISPHLCRAPVEEVNRSLQQFYQKLLDLLRRPAVRGGKWQLLECLPAWDGNPSCDSFIAFVWQNGSDQRLVVAVNYASHPSQCYVRLPFPDLSGRLWHLCDLLSDACYDRDGRELQSGGLFLDMPPWKGHIFEMRAD